MKWLFCFVLLTVSFSSFSQEHSNESWWKKLFKKETVDELNEVGTTESIDSSSVVITSSETINIDTVSNEFFNNYQKGKVIVHSNLLIDSLAGILKEKPLRGYRIQIFFGDLKTAKLERAKYISLKTDTPCYLEQTAPNFAVRIGDYRKEYEAYGELIAIKESYPNAHIVTTNIEFPVLIKE